MADPMRIRANVDAGGVTEVKVLMNHEMETGQRKDAQGKLVPAWFIQNVHRGPQRQDGAGGAVGPGGRQEPVPVVQVQGRRRRATRCRSPGSTTRATSGPTKRRSPKRMNDPHAPFARCPQGGAVSRLGRPGPTDTMRSVLAAVVTATVLAAGPAFAQADKARGEGRLPPERRQRAGRQRDPQHPQPPDGGSVGEDRRRHARGGRAVPARRRDGRQRRTVRGGGAGAQGQGRGLRVCRFTLERNKIDPAKVIPEATLVPSGVAEVSRLQFKEGFAYLRP